MRIDPTFKTKQDSLREEKENAAIIKATRLLAIVIAFLSAFIFFIKILYY